MEIQESTRRAAKLLAERRYRQAAKLLADMGEKTPTLTHTNSEQHSSGRSDEHRSLEHEQYSSSHDSERISSQRSSAGSHSTTSSGGHKDSTGGHRRARSTGKRNSSKALLFQRAAQLLATNGTHTAADLNKCKQKQSSALDSKDPQKRDEPERNIVSL